MLQVQRFLEALDGWAKVTQFDVDLCLFNIDFRNGLVIKQHLVKLDKCQVQVFWLESLLSSSQFLKDLVLLDLVEVKFRLHNKLQSVTKLFGPKMEIVLCWLTVIGVLIYSRSPPDVYVFSTTSINQRLSCKHLRTMNIQIIRWTYFLVFFCLLLDSCSLYYVLIQQLIINK